MLPTVASPQAKPGLEETVKIGIVAATAHPQVDYSKGNNSRFPYAESPEMIVNYVSCHDDLCLTDKLKKIHGGESEENMLNAAKLAQTDHSLHISGHSVHVRRRGGVQRQERGT